MSGGLTEPCPLLPVEMTVCPVCNQGIRPARGYTWVQPAMLVPARDHGTAGHVAVCPFGPDAREESEHRMGERAGLIWIGEVHYPTADAFMREANEMGVSRRITAVPRDFIVGETWVLLGHRKAIQRACPDCGSEDLPEEECPACDDTGVVYLPGVVTAFRPTAIEYVVKGTETEEEIEAMEKRGLTCVRVINDGEQGALEV